MIVKRPGKMADTLAVTFQLPAIVWADRVTLVGDFNEWSLTATCLTHGDESQPWEVTLELPRHRAFQFRYLVNGYHWENDWQADRYAPNPFGGENSVVET
jgi:1,4-alpha-glucan branching enzyme